MKRLQIYLRIAAATFVKIKKPPINGSLRLIYLASSSGSRTETLGTDRQKLAPCSVFVTLI